MAAISKKRRNFDFEKDLNKAISKNNASLLRQLTSDKDNFTDVLQNRAYRNAFFNAIKCDYGDCCSILIENGVDVNECDSEGNSALNVAVYNNKNPSIVALLLSLGADVNLTNAIGQTPLSVACQRGNVDMVDKLMASLSCEVNKCDVLRKSPLCEAAENGSIEVVRTLLKNSSVDINWADREGSTPLIIACCHGNLAVINELINAGANVNAHDCFRKTALRHAVNGGNAEIVKALIQARADVDVADTKGVTPLIAAVHVWNLDIIEQLLKAGCGVNCREFSNGFTAVHVAVKHAIESELPNDLRVLETLARWTGVDVNIADNSGIVPLYTACVSGACGVVELLLACGASLACVSNTGDTVCHAVVLSRNTQLASTIITRAQDTINIANSRGQLPLHVAVNSTINIEMVRSLLTCGSRVNDCADAEGKSPLFLAVAHRNQAAVAALIAAGARVNCMCNNGQSPLWLACSSNDVSIAHMLLAVPDVDVNAGYAHIALHAAAHRGDLDLVSKLLAKGADPNKLNDMDMSALYIAAEADSVCVIRELLLHYANPSAHYTRRGRCCRKYCDPHPHLELEPLQAAFKNDNVTAMRLILSATPRAPYRVLSTLHDLVYRTAYARDARLSAAVLDELSQFFSTTLSSPRSLQHECCGVIRLAVGYQHLPEGVDLLPLPRDLKRRVLMEHLFDT